MIYLILSIVSFTAMMLIFKLIEKFKADTFQAIVINYLTAAILGFSIMSRDFSVAQISHSEWFSNAIVVGISFITLFNVIGITAQKIGISVSTIANKMSVIIPVIFAFFLYGDEMSVLKIIGIILALTGVYLSTKKEEEDVKIPSRLLILPLILFLGSGLLDAFINYTEKYYLPDRETFMNFIPTVFTISAISGGVVMISRIIISPSIFSLRSLFWGFLLGLCNYASLFFFIESLKLDYLNSSVVFMINNVGIVSLSTIAAKFIFNEHLSKKNRIGIGLSIFALLIISLF